MNELEQETGFDGYGVWTMMLSGDSFTRRGFVRWVDGWADTIEEDPGREARMAEAGGAFSRARCGQPRFAILWGKLVE